MSSDAQRDDQPRASRPGVDGWDRIGEFMSRMNETGAVIAQRQVDVWNEIYGSTGRHP